MTPEEIARGLTKDEREAVKMIDTEWRTSFGLLFRRYHRPPVTANSMALTRLCRKRPDLFEVTDRFRGSRGGTTIRITPLGLAVRAALKEMNDG